MRDLTKSSGFQWNGMKGKGMSQLPTINMCSGSYRKVDGLHVMDGALIDGNRDGLPDLVTIVQLTW